jgi:hypothetical protein
MWSAWTPSLGIGRGSGRIGGGRRRIRRAHGPHFLTGHDAVGVGVERADGGGGAGDLGSRDFTVTVGIEHAENRRQAAGTTGAAMPRAGGLVGGGGLGEEGFGSDESADDEQASDVFHRSLVHLAAAAVRKDSEETDEVVNLLH